MGLLEYWGRSACQKMLNTWLKANQPLPTRVQPFELI